jgi:Uncharacterized protein family UPF0029
VGYFIPLTSSSLLPRHKTLLETLPELALADHKIMAWKIGQTTGFHDDGEKWAGRKVLDILIASEDEGLLCVARWYGGIMLGPARFDHIVHVAADALATYHLSLKKSPIITSPTMNAPTIIPSESDEERGRLVRMLRGKDMTVESLRGMISRIKAEQGELSQQSPAKEKNYERMGMDALKRLVVARDAAIQSLRDIHRGLSASVSDSAEKATQGSASHHETGSYTEGTKDLKLVILYTG